MSLAKWRNIIRESDTKDTVTFDIPLLMRLFEYAREEIKDDTELHILVEALVDLGLAGNTLTMGHYSDIIKRTAQFSEPKGYFRNLMDKLDESAKQYDYETMILNPDEEGPDEIEVGLEVRKVGTFIPARFGSPAEFPEAEDIQVFDKRTGESITTKVGDETMSDLFAFVNSEIQEGR